MAFAAGRGAALEALAGRAVGDVALHDNVLEVYFGLLDERVRGGQLVLARLQQHRVAVVGQTRLLCNTELLVQYEARASAWRARGFVCSYQPTCRPRSSRSHS